MYFISLSFPQKRESIVHNGQMSVLCTKTGSEKMMLIYISFIVLLTACSNSGQTRTDERLLKETEHHIKNNSLNMECDSITLSTGWYDVVDSGNGCKRQLDKSNDTFYIAPKPIVTASNFTTLKIYESDASGSKYVGLSMQLDAVGTEKWRIATERAIGRRLAFILDNKLLYVPKVQAQITAGVTALNRGNYTRQELEHFKTIIESER